MLSVPRNLTILTLLCSWSVCILAQDSVVRSFSKKFTAWEQPEFIHTGNELHFNKIGERVFNYICQYSEDSNSQLCNVTVLSWPFARGTYFTSCENYKLSDDKTEVAISYLTPDNIIHFLIINEVHESSSDMHSYYKLNLNILNMHNCTTMANIQIVEKLKKIEVFGFSPTYFDKMFELRVINEKYCNGMSSCKISYEFNGKQIGNPKAFPTEYKQDLLPVDGRFPEAGYYLFRCNDTKKCLGYELEYINSSGSSKKLTTAVEPKKYESPHEFSFVNNGGLLSFCQIDHLNLKQVSCLQFDTQTVRMNVTIELPKKAGAVAVHNLVGGGMLMWIIHCDAVSQDSVFERKLAGCNEFWIQRVSATGHKEALVINGFDTDYANFDPSYRLITENDQNEFCFISSGRMGESNHSENHHTMLYNKLCIPKQSIY